MVPFLSIPRKKVAPAIWKKWKQNTLKLTYITVLSGFRQNSGGGETKATAQYFKKDKYNLFHIYLNKVENPAAYFYTEEQLYKFKSSYSCGDCRMKIRP